MSYLSTVAGPGSDPAATTLPPKTRAVKPRPSGGGVPCGTSRASRRAGVSLCPQLCAGECADANRHQGQGTPLVKTVRGSVRPSRRSDHETGGARTRGGLPSPRRVCEGVCDRRAGPITNLVHLGAGPNHETGEIGTAGGLPSVCACVRACADAQPPPGAGNAARGNCAAELCAGYGPRTRAVDAPVDAPVRTRAGRRRARPGQGRAQAGGRRRARGREPGGPRARRAERSILAGAPRRRALGLCPALCIGALPCIRQLCAGVCIREPPTGAGRAARGNCAARLCEHRAGPDHGTCPSWRGSQSRNW